MNTSTSLPEPQQLRWQPLRCGLINLFHYGDEQFWFENGRMILRGHNGTGKSRVLALQLPFLLDGELNPVRMEPDRSPHKRPEWNLLMGKYRDRLGYTWLEFGRRDERGVDHYLTLGCGLHAVEHRPSMDRWFFITTQRYGAGLALISENVALSKARLTEALGNEGQVFLTAGDYRRTVNEQLFQLGGRYDKLIDLLLQLRMPQLSRDLDEQRLNAALSGALPPLPSELIQQVAEAMRDLDEDRKALVSVHENHRYLDEFMAFYKQYLLVGLRRQATDLTKAHAEVEKSQQYIQQLNLKLTAAIAAIIQAEKDHHDAKLQEASLDETLQTLQASPEMQGAQRLSDARREMEQTEKLKRDATARVQRIATRTEEAQKHAQQTQERLEREHSLTEERIRELQASELPIRLAEATRTHLREITSLPEYAESIASLRAVLDRQRTGHKILSNHAMEIEVHERQVGHLQSLRSQCERRRDDAQEVRALCHSARLQAFGEIQAQVRAWWEQTAILREFLPSVQDLLENLHMDDDSESGTRLVGDLAQTSYDRCCESIRQLITALQRQFDDVQERQSQAMHEQTSLERGEHQPPPPPVTRDPNIRQNLVGAPLWFLCDFAEEVPERERANWEGGLEAAGLLDAWVTSSGEILDPMFHDTFLLPVSHELPFDRQLARVLQPATEMSSNSSVPRDVVQRLLERIGVGPSAGETWVNADGQWQVGALRGCWTKTEVQHIGHLARESRRRRRMQELQRSIDAWQRELDALRTERLQLEERQASAIRERDSVPNDRLFVAATEKVRAANVAFGVAEAELDKSEKELQQACVKQRQLYDRRDRDAMDLELESWIKRLAELKESLSKYEQSLDGLARDLERLGHLRSDSSAADHRLQHALIELEVSREEVDEAAEEFVRAEARHKVLSETDGVAANAILARIAEAKLHRRECSDRAESLSKSLRELGEERGLIRGGVKQREVTLANEEETRRRHLIRFQVTADQGLFQEIDWPQDLASQSAWSNSRGLEVARKLNSMVPNKNTENQAWERLQDASLERLRKLEHSLLPSGYIPESKRCDELLVVSIPFRGQRCSIQQMHFELGEDARHREALLTERERLVFDQRLMGDIATALHRCIRDADQLVRQMNHEVESRPMSTGMRLRFDWRVIDDSRDDLQAARKALLGRPDTLSPKQKEALGGFLRARIESARQANEIGSWQQHLDEALDYRRWHEFHVMQYKGETWSRLTKRTHGTGSGGERAVALTIPMLAAVAAYYKSAVGTAPRIILMDEAFAGIDSDMRGKCMELLVTFDLDFVMTSEMEWGCYPTVPSLAIYNLATKPGMDAILATRWVWNGRERKQVDHVVLQQDLGLEWDDEVKS